MRGIGNNDDQITQDPSVAVYLDGVYTARVQGLAMEVADIQRIEVLRGPQGSLYGRNATGGAINFVTVAPELEQWGFTQELEFGNREHLRSKTMVNIPLGETFAVKASFLKMEEDGFVENRGTGVDRFGDRDRQAYRIDTRWQPADSLDIRYSYDRSDIEDTPAYMTAVPPYPGKADRPHEGSPFVSDLRANDVSAQGHALTASWEINDSMTFKSITAYRKLDFTTHQNYLTGAHPLMPTRPVYVTYYDATQQQWSQEFQLMGDAFDSRLEYIAGLYYFNEEGESFDTSLSPRSASARDVTIENTAYAAFGEATWKPPVLDDRLRITAGARYSIDEREATLHNIETAGGVDTVTTGRGDDDFNNFSSSLVVSYGLSHDVNVYAKVVEGYKTGGYNVRASAGMFDKGFDEETVVSYELGAKTQLWNNRLRVNAAIFRADYKDIQLNTQSDPNRIEVTDVLNAGKATIEGVELDISAAVLEELTVNLNYGYLNPKYDEIINAAGVDVADEFQFTNSPRHSYTLDAEYRFPQMPYGQLTAWIGYTWQDEKFSSSGVDADNPWIIGDYGLLDARLSLSAIPLPAGDLEVALWGRNLEDREYYRDQFNAGLPAAYFGEPRSYGIEFVYRY